MFRHPHSALIALALTGSATFACTKTTPEPMNAAPLPAPTLPVAVGLTAAATDTGAMPAHGLLQGAAADSRLPPGHPPIGGGGAGMAPMAQRQGEQADVPDFAAPASWQQVPPRPMLVKVYKLPREPTETDAAEVTVSFLGAGLPLAMNVARWCGQFQLATGETCETAAKQSPIAGAKHPATLVEIAGTWQAGTPESGGSAAKTGWKMAVVAVAAPDKTWYFKLVGPGSAVDRWQNAVVAMAKSAP